MDADLGRRRGFGEQTGDEVPRARVLHPGVEGLVAASGVRQGAPGAGQGHRHQQRQQERMQHRQDAGRGDQGDQRVHHARAVADHVSAGAGSVLGGVQQLVKGVVLDRGELDRGRPLQVQLRRHPLHLGLQPPGGIRRSGPQQCREQEHGGHQGQCGGCAAQPVLDHAAGDQPAQHGVHRQQADRLCRAPGDLGRQDDAGGSRVGLPGQAEGRGQQGRQPGHHGPEVELQEGVPVLVPARVVAERSAEQQPLRLGDVTLVGTCLPRLRSLFLLRRTSLSRLSCLPHRRPPRSRSRTTATIAGGGTSMAGRRSRETGRAGVRRDGGGDGRSQRSGRCPSGADRP